MNWMLCAILVCGASMVMTSCGDDDDNDNKGSETTPNTYEVVVGAILPKCTAEYFDLQVDYTDANGKKNTLVVSAGDQTETLNAEMKAIYDEQKDFCISLIPKISAEQKAKFDQYIVKNIKIAVPAGKSCSFAGTIKARKDYKISSPEIDIITPVVVSTCRRVSGNSPDNSNSGYSMRQTITAYLAVDTSYMDELMENLEGRDVGKASINL